MAFNLQDLKPGDCLLYSRIPFRKSKIGFLIGLFINIKTWSRFSHVEVYNGLGVSMASRDGIGVDFYRTRLDELVKVRRPGADYNHAKAKAWFQGVRGQGYDLLGLLCFFWAGLRSDPSKMFCSEFARRLYREGGLELFNPNKDSDHISPEQLDQTNGLVDVFEK